VAAILLRRTQAERVVSPYLELISNYPTFEALSKAEVVNVRYRFKPLGIIKRADLMIAGAKIVVSEYGGMLPRSVDLIMRLPGMGKYSSRAVACLAFGARVPMIDESSGRLLRRVLGLGSSGPAYCDHKLFEVAEGMIPEKHPREYNLGLLDIAAANCHSSHPACLECPLSKFCSYQGSQ
jgi:A/G-specific adenine glycosylase